MPEGHTTHRPARRIRKDLVGARRRGFRAGSFPRGAALLDGRNPDRVDAYGKHLFLGWGDDILHIHQSVVAGIGNVFRSELCFLAGVDPRVRAHELDDAAVTELWDLARAKLRIGVRLGRIVAADPDEIGAPVGPIPRGDRLYVYKRPDCLRCGAPVGAFELGGRMVYTCTVDQAS